MAVVMEVKVELLERLKDDYPQLVFRVGKKFMFRPPRTIIYEPIEKFCVRGSEKNVYDLCLLHEVGHALLGHRDFRTDPERLKMERTAWEKARELADGYGVEYDEELVEDRLDSYRDWLHRRSRCPKCGLTRFQSRSGEYRCPNCDL